MRESLSIQEVLRLLSKFSPLENTDNLDEVTQLLHTTRLSNKMTATLYLSIIHFQYFGHNREVEAKHQMEMLHWQGNDEIYGIDGEVESG
jgi:hypothetical protein